MGYRSLEFTAQAAHLPLNEMMDLWGHTCQERPCWLASGKRTLSFTTCHGILRHLERDLYSQTRKHGNAVFAPMPELDWNSRLKGMLPYTVKHKVSKQEKRFLYQNIRPRVWGWGREVEVKELKIEARCPAFPLLVCGGSLLPGVAPLLSTWRLGLSSLSSEINLRQAFGGR